MKNIGSKFILLLILTLHPLCVFSTESVEISGKILVPEKVIIPEGGLDVVLLKFVVNEQGEITTTGPQAGSKVNRMAVSEFLRSQETYVPHIELELELKADFTSPMLFS